MNQEIKLIKSTLLLDNKSKVNIDYRRERVSPSSFDIPKILYAALLNKIGSEARIDTYLKKLLDRFRILCYSGKVERFEGIKLKYQEKDQEFERADFRPFSGDWIELRILASMHGMTMTRFFVTLLSLDLEGFEEPMAVFLRGVDPTDLLRHPIAYTQTLYKTRANLRKYIRFGNRIHEFFEIEMFGIRTGIDPSFVT